MFTTKDIREALAEIIPDADPTKLDRAATRLAADLNLNSVATDRIAPRIQVVCSICHGPNVSRDATARWNVDTQDWELAGINDAGFCDDCDCGDVRLENSPIDSLSINNE